jgi:hypothetical protein
VRWWWLSRMGLQREAGVVCSCKYHGVVV